MKIYLDKIRDIRKSNKISLKELAQRMDIGWTTLWAWETGRRQPSEAKLRMLAKVLNIGIERISDLPPDKTVNDVNFSEAMESWGSIAGKHIESNKEVDILISGIVNLKKKMEATRLIIKGIESSISSMFYVKDSELNYVTANDTFLFNISLKSEYSVLGKKDDDFFPLNEAKKNTSEDHDVLTTGKQVSYEGFIPGSRKKKWGIITKKPILDNNKVLGVVSSFVDITERKVFEKIREVLETNINLMKDCVSIRTFAPERCIYINDAYQRIFGYSKDSLSDYEFWLNNCVEKEFINSEKKFLNNKKWPELSSYRIVRKDGEIRDIERYYHKLDISGKDYYFFIESDITEFNRQKGKIEKFNEAVLAGGDVLWISGNAEKPDGESLYEYISQNTYELMGLEPEELYKDPVCWIEKVGKLDRKRIDEWLAVTSYPKEIEFRYMYPNEQEKWMRARVCKKNNTLYTLFYDISKNKYNEFSRIIFDKFMLSVNDVIWVIKYPYDLLYYTGSTKRLFGVSLDGESDPLKYWYDNILLPDDRVRCDKYAKKVFDYLEKIKQEARPTDYEVIYHPPIEKFVYKIVKPDKSTAYIESKSSFIYYNEELYSITVDSDITEKYLTSETLNRIKSLISSKKELSDSDKKILNIIA